MNRRVTLKSIAKSVITCSSPSLSSSFGKLSCFAAAPGRHSSGEMLMERACAPW